MNDFSDEFDEIFDMDLRQTITETDPKVLTVKQVGDIITITDYSAVTSDADTNEIDDDVINIMDEFIVIEINQNNYFKHKYMTYKQDLVVVNRRTSVKYRTPSYFTRIK